VRISKILTAAFVSCLFFGASLQAGLLHTMISEPKWRDLGENDLVDTVENNEDFGTKERSNTNAHRKGGEEQCYNAFIPLEIKLCKGRELGEIRRANKPKPGDPNNRKKNGSIAHGMFEDHPRFIQKVVINSELRCCGF